MKFNHHNKFGSRLLVLHLLVAGVLAFAACQPIVDTQNGETPPALAGAVQEEDPGATETTDDAATDDAATDEEATDEEATESSATLEAEILLDPAIATITTRSLRVREAPNSDSEVVAGAREGESYPVLAMSDDGAWVQIEIDRSETGEGWVSTNFISLEGDITETETAPVAQPPAEPRTVTTDLGEFDGPAATIDTRSLRVRAEPDEEAEIIAGLNLGDRFNVLGISADGVWILLELSEIEEEEGWVQANFVRLTGDLTAIPTIGADGEEVVAEEEDTTADALDADDETVADEAVDDEAVVDEAVDDEADEATVTDTSDLAFATATVSTRSLFVRELPDASSDPVAGAREGESYAVIGISEDGLWIEIETERSETGVGWVSAEFVTLE
jgi:uncharacterized protein YgiM (DUF1202 family)